MRAASVCGVAFLLLPERVVIPESPLSLPVLVAAVPAGLTQGERQSRPLDPETGVKIAAPFDDIVYVGGDTQGALNLEYRIPIVGRTVTLAPPLAPSLPQGTGPGAPPTALAAQAVAAPIAIPPPAQVQVGSLSGSVFDQSGAVVPGVTIRLLNTTSGSIQTMVTNERGAYAFPQVNVGNYTFEARLPGFINHSRSLVVRPQPEVHDAVLHFGFETHIEVSVEAPSAAPAPAVPPPGPLRVGGDIAAPNLIYAPKPVYPPGAYAKLAQDSVKLDAVLGKDGLIQSLQVNPMQGGSNFELIRAAIDAVKQWRYRPALLNGAPIEVPLTITVNFTMQ